MGKLVGFGFLLMIAGLYLLVKGMSGLCADEKVMSGAFSVFWGIVILAGGGTMTLWPWAATGKDQTGGLHH